MLEAALSYATDDEDLTEPYLIGSGLLLGSFIVGITGVPLYGYYLQALDAGRREIGIETGTGTTTEGLPEFDDWKLLVIDGLKMILVNLAYTGIPAIVFSIIGVLTLVGIGLSASVEGSTLLLIALLVGGVVTLLSGFLVLAGALMAPAALARTRAKDDVEAAFEVRAVFDVATTGEYLITILVAYVFGFVVSMVGFVFTFLLVGFPILFFGGLVTFHLYGQGYASAVASINEVEPAAAGSAV